MKPDAKHLIGIFFIVGALLSIDKGDFVYTHWGFGVYKKGSVLATLSFLGAILNTYKFLLEYFCLGADIKKARWPEYGLSLLATIGAIPVISLPYIAVFVHYAGQ